MKQARGSLLARFLRLYLWVLLAALLVGFGIGLVIRQRLEAPRIHMGSVRHALTAVAAPTPAP